MPGATPESEQHMKVKITESEKRPCLLKKSVYITASNSFFSEKGGTTDLYMNSAFINLFFYLFTFFNLIYTVSYILRINIIRKECGKRWAGNEKIYFKSNNGNSLVLSEMCSSLLPVCEIKKIRFGQSKDKQIALMILQQISISIA